MSNINNFNDPHFKKWSVSDLYAFEEQIVDYETLEELGTSINAARISLFKITDQINKYERLEKEAKTKYDRTWRREYVTSVEKTDALKRAHADISCEDIENNYIEYEQVKKELERLSYSLRLELQTLQTLGHNLRQQMKME